MKTLFSAVGGNASLNKTYCGYTSPINIMTMICSLNSVAAVGFNRYLLLCMNKNIYHMFSKKSSLALTIAVIWIWSFMITLPPMFGYGEFGYHTKFHTCFFKAYDQESWMYGTIFCCVLGVFPPVMASTFFYGKILLKLHRNKQNLQRHFKKIPLSSIRRSSIDQVDLDSSSSSTNANNSNSCLEREDSCSVDLQPERKLTKNKSSLLLRQNAQQRRSVLMLLTIFVIIVVCWLPISISFICDRQNRLPSTVYVCFVVLAWMNSCINIFIYAAMNIQFRKGYKSLLMRPCKGMTATVSSVSMVSDVRMSTDVARFAKMRQSIS